MTAQQGMHARTELNFDGPEHAARRTGAALVASALAVLPLRQVFTDWSWLPDVWASMLLTLGPAALLRMRWSARSSQLLPGLIIATCYLTVRFVPDHAWAGLLPLRGTWPDISAMINAFGDTVRNDSAPLHSTPAVRMMLAVQLTLMAVVVDLLAVVARRPALAGVPFLLVFTLSGAVPRQSVAWLWFALAAAGYLLLLGSDTRDEMSRWGRLMPRNVAGSRAAVKALSARRIAVIAIALAVAIPLILPTHRGNLIADALRGGSGGGGGGGGVSLDPFVSLKGQLSRNEPENLFHVTTSGLGDHQPFYLREFVLDTYNSSGWHAGNAGEVEQLDTTSFESEPFTSNTPSYGFTATISIDKLNDVQAPIFQSPTGIQGLSGGFGWSRLDSTVVDGRIQHGDRYTETVAEPAPTAGQLAQSPSLSQPIGFTRWLRLPASAPAEVTTLVKRLTGAQTTPYARARAILAYFSSDNGFSYSLSTKAGDSGSDLVDFLTNKTGFCQQYAAAMAVMLRMAAIPARVVVGYTHAPTDENGTFKVTTNDAHAWVEAYFANIGWVPFDPTPLVGADAERAATIPWAPRPDSPVANAPTSASASTPAGRDVPSRGLSGQADGLADTGSSQSSGLPNWVAWLVVGLAVIVVGIAIAPAMIRLGRRRARLRAAARGPDPLWQELADTAVDLGYVWSPVRSPRQVVTWLRREGVPRDVDGALRSLATAVEVSRYAAPGQPAGTATLVNDLRKVESSLRAQRTGWERARARLLPQSIGWLRLRWWRRTH